MDKKSSTLRVFAPLAAACALLFANVAVAQSVQGINQAREGSINFSRNSTDTSTLWNGDASLLALQSEINTTTNNATTVYNLSQTISGSAASVQNTINSAQNYVNASNTYAVAAYNSSVAAYNNSVNAVNIAASAASIAQNSTTVAGQGMGLAQSKVPASGSAPSSADYIYVTTAGIPYECGGPLAGFTWTDADSITHNYAVDPVHGNAFGESNMGQNCGQG